jgi:hypothetical protein
MLKKSPYEVRNLHWHVSIRNNHRQRKISGYCCRDWDEVTKLLVELDPDFDMDQTRFDLSRIRTSSNVCGKLSKRWG